MMSHTMAVRRCRYGATTTMPWRRSTPFRSCWAAISLLLWNTAPGRIVVVPSFTGGATFATAFQQQHRSLFGFGRGDRLGASFRIRPTKSASVDDAATTTSSTNDDDDDDDNYMETCQRLCPERNLPLERVKNCRDLASVRHSPVVPHRLYRTGRIGEASAADIELLLHELNITTLIDTRSPTELRDDATLMRSNVFGNFTNVLWREPRRRRRRQHQDQRGCVQELAPGESPLQAARYSNKLVDVQKQGRRRMLWRRQRQPQIIGNSVVGEHEVVAAAAVILDDDNDDEEDNNDLIAAVGSAGNTHKEALSVDEELAGAIAEPGMDDDDDNDELCGLDCEEEVDGHPVESGVTSLSTLLQTQASRKERHFVSLMDEFKYVKGTVSRLRKRDLTRAVLKSPGALVSKKWRDDIKKPFLDEINGGGLPLLNELLLRYGAPGLRHVLEICSDRARHPVAFYCTAGKDRTGMIAAIVLSLCGAAESDIVEDYMLSANVYAEMNDHAAMVGALSQRNLDAKTFLGAPPAVMRDTLRAVNQHYGSVADYCTWIGFGPEQQAKLRAALTEE